MLRVEHRMNCCVLEMEGPSESSEPSEPSEPLRILYSLLLSLLLLPAALMNLTLLLTLLWSGDPDHRAPPEHRGSSRGPGSCFTLSLGASDLLLSLSVVPAALYCAAAGVRRVEEDSLWCQTGGFLLVLLQTSSLHSRMWAAVGQYSEIRHALSNDRLWTSMRIRVLVLLLWLYSIINAALPVLRVGKYRYSPARALCVLSLVEVDAISRGMSLSWLSISMATPLVLACVLQGYVAHVARVQARRGTFRCNETHCFYIPAQAYERSAHALLISTASLVLCWAPYLSVCLYEGLSLDLVPLWVSQGSMFLVLSSCAVNPAVTCLTQIQYRTAARVFMSRLLQLTMHPSPAYPPEATNQISTTRTSLPGVLVVTT
uniref:G-protein coupled receptors family 1 profile domain-containing protein n=1 Tax=Knipowitschia caucasica TaxID=637954 RepID=A0AAV2JF91_KNICA